MAALPDPAYDVGDLVRLRVALTDAATGSPIVPSMIALHTRTQAGSLASYAQGGASPPIAEASGIYYADVLLTAPGVVDYRWRATGPHMTEPSRLSVASSPFGD